MTSSALTLGGFGLVLMALAYVSAALATPNVSTFCCGLVMTASSYCLLRAK